MILIICGLSFDQMTPIFEILIKWYPAVVIIAILGLIISIAYYIYRDKSVLKGIMVAFCLSHTMFFGLSVPYEILWTFTLESDPFVKLIGTIVFGMIFCMLLAFDNALVISAINSEGNSMRKMGITGVLGWIACAILLF